MKKMIVAGLLALLAACAADPYSDPAFDRFKGDAAGLVVLDALKRQGYLNWTGEYGLVYNLRTRKTAGEETVTEVETITLDLDHVRILINGNRGGVFIRKAFMDGSNWETWDQELMRDSTGLAESRYRLLFEYLWTALPFILGDLSADLVTLEPLILDEVLYDPVEVRFPVEAYFFPGSSCTLYITHSTRLLEKVRFQADSGPMKGKTVWCDMDNFTDIDGVFIPLHRTFTVGGETEHERLPEPFMEQWLFKMEFTGRLKDKLFSPPQN